MTLERRIRNTGSIGAIGSNNLVRNLKTNSLRN